MNKIFLVANLFYIVGAAYIGFKLGFDIGIALIAMMIGLDVMFSETLDK